MSAVEFSHTDWENVRREHGVCVWTCGTVVFGVYGPAGNRVAASLVTLCGGVEPDGFEPGAAEEAVQRLAVAYPGCEVLLWWDPFMPVAARRGEAFEPAASSGGVR